MKKVKHKEVTVCDRCGSEFTDWTDRINRGEIIIYYNSIIGDIFAQGAFESREERYNVSKVREYFDSLDFVDFHDMPHQSLKLEFGTDDHNYDLCMHCTSDLLHLLGEFFQKNVEDTNGT